MDLRDLTYFVEAASTASFRKAAENLFVSEPSLSRQMRALEAELGVRLFDRSHRGIQLTPAGRVWLTQAKMIISQMNRSTSLLHDIAGLKVERLRLGIPPVGALPAITNLLERLYQTSPGLVVEISELRLAEQQLGIRDGKLDVGFTFLTRPPGPEFQIHQLMTMHLGMLVPSTHPAAKNGVASLQDFAADRILIPVSDPNSDFHDHLVACCRSAGFEPVVPTRTIVGNYSPGMTALVVATEGVVAFRFEEIGGGVQRDVAKVKLEPPIEGYPLVALWHRTNVAPGLNALLGLL